MCVCGCLNGVTREALCGAYMASGDVFVAWCVLLGYGPSAVVDDGSGEAKSLKLLSDAGNF